MKLSRYVYCTKVGKDGCVNTEGAEHADAGWHHWCPACKSLHAIAVEHPFENGARWTFNGDQEKPTFKPSVKVNWPTVGGAKQRICHYVLTDGIINYCGDCTHELRDQKIPLPDIPHKEI